VHGPSLGEVERLTLRDAFDDVHENDVAQLLSTVYCATEAPTLPAPTTVISDADAARSISPLCRPACRHYSVSMFFTIAVPNSEHLTSFAPSMSRAKS